MAASPHDSRIIGTGDAMENTRNVAASEGIVGIHVDQGVHVGTNVIIRHIAGLQSKRAILKCL